MEAAESDLGRAASAGDFETVRELVLAGTDPNCSCQNKQTPLHWASMIGHLDICRFLTEFSNADKNAQNHNGMTPIMLAVSSHHIELGKSSILYVFYEFTIVVLLYNSFIFAESSFYMSF